ncbi:hypothetical protein BJ508DRAFT_306429 [Ascobolus immersus RN42]|uniref:Uncharacterized protein n=1 Tax=Ascobolus immersus RN42 TaxID=1160509 RepID=A0A3N4I6B1_ASCIM|nr:hypothetical protein BJ508DRAFT_306429 [Ascobolus immersus RN42]
MISRSIASWPLCPDVFPNVKLVDLAPSLMHIRPCIWVYWAPIDPDINVEGIVTNRSINNEEGYPVITATLEYWAPSQNELLISRSVIYAHAGIITREFKPGAGIDHPEKGPDVYDGTLRVLLRAMQVSVFPGSPMDKFYHSRIPLPSPPFGSFKGITGHSYDPEIVSENNLRYFDLRTTVYDRGSSDNSSYTTFSVRVFIPLTPRWTTTRTPSPNFSLAIQGPIVGIVQLGSKEMPDDRLAIMLDGLAFIPTTRGGGTDAGSAPQVTPQTPRTPRRRGWLAPPDSGSSSVPPTTGSANPSTSALFGTRSQVSSSFDEPPEDLFTEPVPRPRKTAGGS